jgi:hypothetical protein
MMSVMRCSKCEKDIDTDFDDYDFKRDMCVECSVEDDE